MTTLTFEKIKETFEKIKLELPPKHLFIINDDIFNENLRHLVDWERDPKYSGVAYSFGNVTMVLSSLVSKDDIYEVRPDYHEHIMKPLEIK